MRCITRGGHIDIFVTETMLLLQRALALCLLLGMFLQVYAFQTRDTRRSRSLGADHHHLVIRRRPSRSAVSAEKISLYDHNHLVAHRPSKSASEKVSLYDSSNDAAMMSRQQQRNPSSDSSSVASNQVEWVSFGLSYIYLAHFASIYTQLPGLYGSTGLLPVSLRVPNLDGFWAFNSIPWSPEVGLELFAAVGIIVSTVQILLGTKLRKGPAGVLTFGLLWLLWHDLVMAGGRFTAYQMDLLLLDAAPISVLAASGLVPAAASFGYRWLLARLYLGAGAVKLLSCDKSWRDLSAVHWHFQSQPLPNPVGQFAFLDLPEGLCKFATLAVLVAEMAAPFLFLAPSSTVRKWAFILNILLMVSIATFGNFGPLQMLLIIIGFALLDDLPSLSTAGDDQALTSVSDRRQEKGVGLDQADVDLHDTDEIDILSVGLSTICVALAAGGAAWAIIDVGSLCRDSLAVSPLVIDLVALGGVIAVYPLLSGEIASIGPCLASLAIFASSAGILANGLGVHLPLEKVFDFFDIGTASPYGLFAIITGVGGRPVAAIEAASSADDPTWVSIPLLYQINDPSSQLPLCFPHFPRLDWTLWFLPLGEPSGSWIAGLYDGITRGDESIIGLLDKEKYYQLFPTEPPAIVRIVPRTYEFSKDTAKSWKVAEESDERFLSTYQRGDFPSQGRKDAQPWPQTPLLRKAAETNRPEYFVWGCVGTTATAEILSRRMRIWLGEAETKVQ